MRLKNLLHFGVGIQFIFFASALYSQSLLNVDFRGDSDQVKTGLAATGHALGDTPIPFLVIVSTLVMLGGQGLRSRAVSPSWPARWENRWSSSRGRSIIGGGAAGTKARSGSPARSWSAPESRYR